MVTCPKCGDLNVQYSENTRPNFKGQPRKWLINVNTGRDHECPKRPEGNTRNTTKTQTCRYGCGTPIEYYPGFYLQPKYREVNTSRQHTYARCANIFRLKGLKPPFTDNNELEIWDYDLETQLQLIKHLPPESKTWDWFRPRSKDKLGFYEAQKGIYSLVQLQIRDMNLMQYYSLLIHLGHKKPLPSPTIEV